MPPFTCDRCHSTFENRQEPKDCLIIKAEPIHNNTVTAYDLCPSCFDSFNNWLTT